jgi:hypothetical protein
MRIGGPASGHLLFDNLDHADQRFSAHVWILGAYLDPLVDGRE